MKEFTITTELINKVLEYLGTRPYVETNGLIAAIQGEYQEAVKRTELEQSIANMEVQQKIDKVRVGMSGAPFEKAIRGTKKSKIRNIE